NKTDNTYLVSSISVVFRVKRNDILLSDYLFMYFNRSEFDRYARFNSWGSARETFSWEDMCDIDIDLPTIDIQRKYVRIYLAMTENQRAYERGLEDLRIVCDGYIEDLRRKMPCEKIEPYIERYNIRNGRNGTKNVKSISTAKEFRDVGAKVNTEELSNYKVCRPRQFAFVHTTNNEKVFTYAFNNTDKDIVVSSVNDVFSVDESVICPEYLCMFFNRAEFDRYVRFHSWGSVREVFTWDDLCNVSIPIPSIEIQRSIADIYNVCQTRKSISERLKAHIKNICPVLIKGAIEEAQKEEA
ncbi:MAG: restriction endonuclease subunit S, partial [Synergistaceae bacterium]|nr:restriction endonuclease subunit S [Synergistaceae bacterium]